MSSNSRIVMKTSDSKNYNYTVTCELRDGYLEFTLRFTSGTFKSVQQLRVDLETQYQSDRHALIGLNQRFGQHIDRIQLLESENIRYTEQIAHLRGLSSGSSIDVKWHEHYLHLQTDAAMIGNAKVAYEADFEVFQVEMEMYQRLIDVNHQWRSASYLKLEQKLKESLSVLHTLHTSYTELEREIAGLYAILVDTQEHYLKTTYHWCFVKKREKTGDMHIRKLKNQIAFLKKLRSHTAQYVESLSIETVEGQQFWSFELDKCIVKIRRDFELLYGAMYREMTLYYQRKIEESETSVKQAVDYQNEMVEEIAVRQRKLRVECEEAEGALFDQRKIQTELEARYTALSSELESMQSHHNEQFKNQSEEITSRHEYIAMVAYNVDEMRRRKKTLEAEVIIYRYLLECVEIREQVVIIPRPEPVRIETKEELIIETECKRTGAIGITECATNGRYITLKNHSIINEIDISRWQFERRTGSGGIVRYTLQAAVRLQPGQELTLYSKLSQSTDNVSADRHIISSSVYQGLVCNDLVSWGVGNTGTTVLLDHNGQQRASFKQTLVLGRNE